MNDNSYGAIQATPQLVAYERSASRESAVENALANAVPATVATDATSITNDRKTAQEQESQGESGEGAFDQVSRAIENLNKMLSQEEYSLKFEMDENSGTMVIQVKDVNTEEVVRQIPSEEALKFAEYIEGLVGLIFDDQA